MRSVRGYATGDGPACFVQEASLRGRGREDAHAASLASVAVNLAAFKGSRLATNE